MVITLGRVPCSDDLQKFEGTHRNEPLLDFPGSFDDFVEKHPDLASAHG